MKKLPTELSNDELLQLLNDNENEEILPDTDILNFISFYKIQSGNDIVTGNLLYYLYSHWSKNRLPKFNFIKQLSLYINKNNKGFLVNMNAINFSKKALELITPRDKTKRKNYKSYFEHFLKYYSIISGNFWIEDFILYYLYKQWCRNLHKKPALKEIMFYKFCKVYFPEKRNYSEKYSWYQITAPYSYITEEQMENIRNERKNGKNKKTKRKISSG